jgi:hypothetical protein
MRNILNQNGNDIPRLLHMCTYQMYTLPVLAQIICIRNRVLHQAHAPRSAFITMGAVVHNYLMTRDQALGFLYVVIL